MLIKDQIQAIVDGLTPWASTIGGEVFACHDLRHLWEAAMVSTVKVRILVAYNGETVKGDGDGRAVFGFCDRHFIIAVQRGTGYAPRRGDTLIKAFGDAPAFVDLIDQCREILKGMRKQFGLDKIGEQYPDFKNVHPMVGPEDVPMDANAIEFSIGSQQVSRPVPLIPTP